MADVHAFMPGQLMGGCGSRVAGEVFWRTHHGQPPIRAYANGDHVFADRFAHADAGIKSLLDDVGEAIVDVELQRDIRVAGQEFCKHRPHAQFNLIVSTGNTNRATGLVPKLAQRFKLRSDLVKERGNRAHQPFSRLRGRHIACRAGQQSDPQSLFECADRMA